MHTVCTLLWETHGIFMKPCRTTGAQRKQYIQIALDFGSFSANTGIPRNPQEMSGHS